LCHYDRAVSILGYLSAVLAVNNSRNSQQLIIAVVLSMSNAVRQSRSRKNKIAAKRIL